MRGPASEPQFFDTNPLLWHVDQRLNMSTDPLDQALVWAAERAEYDEHGRLTNIDAVRAAFAEDVCRILGNGAQPDDRLERLLADTPVELARAA